MTVIRLQVVGGADKYTALCRHCFRKSDIGRTPLNRKSSTDSSALLNKRYGQSKIADAVYGVTHQSMYQYVSSKHEPGKCCKHSLHFNKHKSRWDVLVLQMQGRSLSMVGISLAMVVS